MDCRNALWQEGFIEILVKQWDKLAEYTLSIESGNPPVIHLSDQSDSSFEEWIIDHGSSIPGIYCRPDELSARQH